MVIVTGGTGLVGSHLLCKLSQSETKIFATYQTKSKINRVKQIFQFYHPKQWESLWTKVEWLKVDINNIPEIEELIQFEDEVYHCAALVSFHHKDFKKLIKINREGTSNMVNVSLAKGIKKMVYVSSTAAITGGDISTVDENSKWKKSGKTSAYSISKYSAEKEVWRGIEEGLNAVMVNPCVILGAGNWDESSLTILREVHKGLKFYPTGGNAIVDARDVVNVMHELMKGEIDSQRFLLIGSNQPFKNLFDTIALKMGKKKPSIMAKRNLLNTAKIILSIGAFFRGKRSPITKETVNSACDTVVYSSEKIKKQLDYSFFTLEETIDNAIKGKIN
jgi:dihydroflavonol-4-reductase